MDGYATSGKTSYHNFHTRSIPAGAQLSEVATWVKLLRSQELDLCCMFRTTVSTEMSVMNVDLLQFVYGNLILSLYLQVDVVFQGYHLFVFVLSRESLS